MQLLRQRGRNTVAAALVDSEAPHHVLPVKVEREQLARVVKLLRQLVDGQRVREVLECLGLVLRKCVVLQKTNEVTSTMLK